MEITQISIILSIISCILTTILLPFTLYALILVKSLEKQTHTVQFMPIDDAVKEDVHFGDEENVFEEINQEQKEENEEIYRMV